MILDFCIFYFDVHTSLLVFDLSLYLWPSFKREILCKLCRMCRYQVFLSLDILHRFGPSSIHLILSPSPTLFIINISYQNKHNLYPHNYVSSQSANCRLKIIQQTIFHLQQPFFFSFPAPLSGTELLLFRFPLLARFILCSSNF